jgi:hypothetical protein
MAHVLNSSHIGNMAIARDATDILNTVVGRLLCNLYVRNDAINKFWSTFTQTFYFNKNLWFICLP